MNGVPPRRAGVPPAGETGVSPVGPSEFTGRPDAKNGGKMPPLPAGGTPALQGVVADRASLLLAIVCLLIAFIVTALGQNEKAALRVTSKAFENGGTIPSKYTCDGADISPPIKWEGVPSEAKSLALICDDPDAPAGTWVHWVIYNIQPDRKSLPEKISKARDIIANWHQGKNDFGNYGYGGPCPPGGKAHRYFFKLYALDIDPKPQSEMSKADLVKAMEGHILAEGSLMGTYQRQ